MLYTPKPPPLSAEPNNFLHAEKPPKNLQLNRKTALNYFMTSCPKIAA